MRKIEFTVGEQHDGRKLITFLRGTAGMSVTLIRSLKQFPDGIMCNGVHMRTIDRVHSGDLIEINIPDEKTQSRPSDFSPEVVYEDEDILVINKPAGLAMHETHNHQGDTLANVVAGYLERSGRSGVFRAVGRLDKDTSGLVVCALHAYSAAALSGNVEKTYLAIAQGTFCDSGTIDTPIYRPDPMKTLRAAGENGESAVTHWTALRSKDNMTLLEIKLETGRTHQIRVHFSSLGAPLMGDDMYGGSRRYISRQALHCCHVELIHPVRREKVCFDAPLPADMKEIVDKLL